MQDGKEIGRHVGALLGDVLPHWIEQTIPAAIPSS
jgi:hypothetical protein